MQGEAIKSLERSKDEMALTLRNEIATALQRKANASDVVGRLTEVCGAGMPRSCLLALGSRGRRPGTRHIRPGAERPDM